MNEPLALRLRLSPPLSWSTTVPESPDTVPPTVYDVVVPVASWPAQLSAVALP